MRFKAFELGKHGVGAGSSPANFRKWELDLSNENGWSVSISGTMVETVR